jgi:stage III sporulation protein AG
MDIKIYINKFKSIIGKYKYACIVLIAGIALLLLPNKKDAITTPVSTQKQTEEKIDETMLSELLESVEGAGKVKVMLSISAGEKTIYQTNHNASGSSENLNTKTETVIISDSQRSEAGLINQINPPVYLGAIIVCQGGDIPSVKLAITQAVAKITGLGADQICVLKMK